MPFDAFLKIDGIDGESTDDKHKGEIEVLSYDHQLTQAGGASGSRTGGQTGSRVEVGEFSFVKVLDKASPNLAKFCCNGKHIASAVLEVCTASEDKHTYMKYTMSDVVISAYHKQGNASSEGDRPTEEVSLRFGKIEWEYTPIDNTGKAGGAVKSGWDTAANKAS